MKGFGGGVGGRKRLGRKRLKRRYNFTLLDLEHKGIFVVFNVKDFQRCQIQNTAKRLKIK
jgi:hypothetical protein